MRNTLARKVYAQCAPEHKGRPQRVSRLDRSVPVVSSIEMSPRTRVVVVAVGMWESRLGDFQGSEGRAAVGCSWRSSAIRRWGRGRGCRSSSGATAACTSRTKVARSLSSRSPSRRRKPSPRRSRRRSGPGGAGQTEGRPPLEAVSGRRKTRGKSVRAVEMPGLRKAWKTRRGSTVGYASIGGAGFPALAQNSLAISTGLTRRSRQGRRGGLLHQGPASACRAKTPPSEYGRLAMLLLPPATRLPRSRAGRWRTREPRIPCAQVPIAWSEPRDPLQALARH